MKNQKTNRTSGLRKAALAAVIVSLLTAGPATATLLVSSFQTDEVLQYNDTTGASEGVFITAGLGGLDRPTGLARDSAGRIYVGFDPVGDALDGAVLRYNADGTFDSVFVTDANVAGIPLDLAFAPDGTLYLSSFTGGGQGTVQRFDTSGSPLPDSWGTLDVRGIEVLAGGDVLLTDGNSTVDRYTADGSTLITQYSVPVVHPGEFQQALSTGPDGKLYLTSDFDRLYVLDLPGAASSFALLVSDVGIPSVPAALGFDQSGNLLVGGSADDFVNRFSPAGASLGTFIAAGSGGLNDVGTAGILQFTPPQPVPEPSLAVLLGIGGLMLWRRMRK